MRLAAVLAALGVTVAGCGSGGDGHGKQLVVFAAASLTDAFGDIADLFERQHPDVAVTLDFGPSSRLAAQIAEGAPADVFASADDTTMAVAVDAGAVRGKPEVFARNRLEIAVPAGNPEGVSGLADLADEDLLIGLCAEEVPCGRFGREALAEAEVEPSIDTNEADVRSLLNKLTVGELDAGLPDDVNVVASYELATLDADATDEAAAFVDLVRSARGQRILAERGFLAP
jgi:molybdate transport system substrate-binding protein